MMEIWKLAITAGMYLRPNEVVNVYDHLLGVPEVTSSQIWIDKKDKIEQQLHPPTGNTAQIFIRQMLGTLPCSEYEGMISLKGD